MARLISPPVGLGITAIEPLSGPRVVGASSSQSIGGFLQTSAAPFGLWRFRFSFHPMRGSAFRAYRGWVTALHGGANATRWHFFDPDMMSPAAAGLAVSESRRWDSMPGQLWSNGTPWANGELWGETPPFVAVVTAVAAGETQISLADQFWGHGLQVGDYLGFFPFHFALHIVTEVIDDGAYRIWPPLRKSLTTDDFATLRPTLAMRLEGEDAASASRGLVVAEGLTATLIEVLDPDVRDYFAD
jgi:hypothetical protein